jgi:hypothetical protein
MSYVDVDYQAILDRIVAIMNADTAVTDTTGATATEVTTWQTGVPREGEIKQYPHGFVVLDQVNDTFYGTGSASEYEMFFKIGILHKSTSGSALEEVLLDLTKEVKEAIKNNTKLGTPGAITTDTKVKRAWPEKVRFKRLALEDRSGFIGGIIITVRAIHNTV